MTHRCRNCKRTFGSRLEYELHRDNCSAEQLLCERCGEKFEARSATEDGWHYACPNEDCEADGIGEELHKVDEVLTTH